MHAALKRLLISAVVSCVAGAGPASAKPSGTLAGRVTDENGQPIEWARVIVRGSGAVGIYQALTDSSGAYMIPGLPSNERLEVRAEAPGKVPVLYSALATRSGAITRRDFRLRPPGHREVLVLYDPRVDYHEIALDGVRSTFSGGIEVLELEGKGAEDADRVREAMEKLPNAVIAIGDLAARTARSEIKQSTIVYTMVPDPSGNFKVANMCGSILNSDFHAQLEHLVSLKPGASRIMTAYDPRRLPRSMKRLRRDAKRLGLSVEVLTARNLENLTAALDAHSPGDYDAFFLLLDAALMDQAALARIREWMSGSSIVYIVPDPSLLETGGTFSYAPGFREMGVHAASTVDKILDGEIRMPGCAEAFPEPRSFTLNSPEAARLGLQVGGADR